MDPPDSTISSQSALPLGNMENKMAPSLENEQIDGENAAVLNSYGSVSSLFSERSSQDELTDMDSEDEFFCSAFGPEIARQIRANNPNRREAVEYALPGDSDSESDSSAAESDSEESESDNDEPAEERMSILDQLMAPREAEMTAIEQEHVLRMLNSGMANHGLDNFGVNAPMRFVTDDNDYEDQWSAIMEHEMPTRVQNVEPEVHNNTNRRSWEDQFDAETATGIRNFLTDFYFPGEYEAYSGTSRPRETRLGDPDNFVHLTFTAQMQMIALYVERSGQTNDGRHRLMLGAKQLINQARSSDGRAFDAFMTFFLNTGEEAVEYFEEWLSENWRQSRIPRIAHLQHAYRTAIRARFGLPEEELPRLDLRANAIPQFIIVFHELLTIQFIHAILHCCNATLRMHFFMSFCS